MLHLEQGKTKKCLMATIIKMTRTMISIAFKFSKGVLNVLRLMYTHDRMK